MIGRPVALIPLFAQLDSLPNIGPKIAKSLNQIGVEYPRDLILHFPYTVIDRCHRDTIQNAQTNQVVTVLVTVLNHRPPANKRTTYRVDVEDKKRKFQVVFFNSNQHYLKRMLPIGEQRVISGKLEEFNGFPQIVHPDYIEVTENSEKIPKFESVYHLTEGVSQKVIQKIQKTLLKQLPNLPEWIESEKKSKEGWLDWKTAIEIAHTPRQTRDINLEFPARTRLSYDELFAHQLTLALIRKYQSRSNGQKTVGTGQLRNCIIKNLPFNLTHDQIEAISEITTDMALPLKMNRMLQGDVGSGKTIVAFMALLTTVEAGGQGVLMAPTEVLAYQHYQTLKPYAERTSVALEILTGHDTGKKRTTKLKALLNGKIDILVGTHSVFQQDVSFCNLRLAIVDEQHKFGVSQRLSLRKKGNATDVLVMTATPIPRSLALSHYGDLDISILKEKPAGRKMIKTAMISFTRMNEIIDRLSKAIRDGQQCYWVCPLIEESEKIDLTSATERHTKLCNIFDSKIVGLVHGQMLPAEKNTAFSKFQTGETKLLVSTTVIEVGVDVPEASIMIIERAEQFGLAQLHQLRGRVGRGHIQSSCILLYQPPLSDVAYQRLDTLRKTEDGFRIAETDLKLRGAGDLIGTVQAGLPRFRIADPRRQLGLMESAQIDARKLIGKDPHLESPRGRAARTLLYLFSQEEVIHLLSVG